MIKKIITMSKDEIIAYLTENKINFSDKQAVPELKALAIAELTKGKAGTANHVDLMKKEEKEKARLENRAIEILQRAEKINKALKGAKDATERTAIIDSFDDELGLGDYIRESFDGIDQADEVLIANDLPASKIITNLPVRILDQVIAKVEVQYPLMNLRQLEMVKNGLKEIFYKDFRDVSNKSGFSDVEMSDYNMGSEPVTKKTYKVDTEISKGYDILDKILNDVTVTPGLFIALINDFVMAVVRPFAKKFYARFMTFLDKVDSYDETISFPNGSDPKAKAKIVYEKLVSLQTPSRNHLKKAITGFAKTLEYVLKPENAVLILNKEYAGNYKYDLSSMTFQLGEITIKVKEIIVLDFAGLKEYSEEVGATALTDNEVILMEVGVYNEIIHYSASKIVNTPKLKTTFNRYDRVGNYRRLDKILIGFKTAPKPAK